MADVRGVAADALRIVRTRLELLSIEFQEEKERIVRQMLVASAALFFAVFGVMLALVWLVLALPEEYRQSALGVLCLLFLAGAGGCWFSLSRKRTRIPFASTLGTLARDEAALKGGDD
ncbi:hypothetical protein DSM104443_00238 [Usitatibacter rugosus]|uniref:Membrane protein YqjE n=1 Tax=Usitatibacter rugosus TaxID=2732067 RepID=A0A6M4GPQ9_9PROT|nr:hypothetical protein DSM104443_00238 [Usitatibacter rugosus]